MAAATLTLTSCSSDSSGSGKDKIAGADTGEAKSPTSSASASASASAEKNAPTFDLPSDIKVTVDKKSTGNSTKDAILRDVAYSVEARLEGFAKGDGQTTNMNRYFAAYARTDWADRVAKVKKEGLTVTGDYRFFDFAVMDVANTKAASARYCEDPQGVRQGAQDGQGAAHQAERQGLHPVHAPGVQGLGR
ncbi:hypothetical protein AB0M87_23720 [Streptomyces sp. NPDC051320]|uniref:hypothetical protein n=1 Tax=Streptomyces sp. NPDC051320 TaxID=3154644 RepID=UPI003443AA7E